ncbi:TIGR03745 family integrating conjugative element membrane protein [Salmonella enterica subsp. enterica]|uniref:TIGR03745 family integrating conjugative element membrane protein n=1 Tax=Citrobacter werkmanii TaxID=67827 RepID=UPI000DFB86F7|nr:TIGR03745 family integrating conjugative element membrane protein [Salmonella enterica subsp. enterica serovar Oranienburg]EAP0853333.1 TIGR03745 family integrating conjugative element membrane protein [Salmonella enterica]EBS0773058.1 TIGR03745 family integrating conjugative element membrane protein [Salmonella enterica subsp. enterica serovar Gaminara]EBS4103933.1 TIGR03745 family integrating conjugative element membrane protein [Salmonella enterica subsp. enterica serovar Poona]ECN5336070
MKLLDRFRQLSLVGSGLFWSAYASADLPKLSGGSSSNDVMGDVKKMSQDGVSYGALVICAIAFIVVVISCVSTYHKIGDGKASWFDFGVRVVVGAIMIVLCIYFLNKAVTII